MEYVDLGLSVKWAKCNLGAKTPEEWGDLYCWAEIEPRSECPSDEEHKYYGKNKYDGDNPLYVLAPEDDAATVKLGREWHIPTREQWQELEDDCIWEKVYDGEKKLIGFKISGKKAPYDKNYIFIPMINCYGFDRGLLKYSAYWTNGSGEARQIGEERGVYAPWTWLYGIRPVFEKK